MRRRLGKGTYANIASTLALVLSLGGAAYALTLPRNSVGTPQLKDNAVKTAKVDNGTLLRKDFRKGQVDPPNMKRFGPANMDVGDAPRTVFTTPGLKLEARCTTETNGAGPDDDTIRMQIELMATVDHLNYQSYEEGGDVLDYDEDLSIGEGANWASHASPALVTGDAEAPETQSVTVVLPGGKGILGRTVMLANRGTSDCTFLGRVDLF
jgi:hypothetical protein